MTLPNPLSLICRLYTEPKQKCAKPACFKNNEKAFMRYLYTHHFWRWLRFATIGFVMMGIGFGILYITVSNMGLKPVVGYLTENLIMLQIGFLLNRYITFGDRTTHWLKALVKWHFVRALMFGLGQGAFFLLVSIIGFQYMLASLTIALSFGLLNYAISNFWAFSGQRRLATQPIESS